MKYNGIAILIETNEQFLAIKNIAKEINFIFFRNNIFERSFGNAIYLVEEKNYKRFSFDIINTHLIYDETISFDEYIKRYFRKHKIKKLI